MTTDSVELWHKTRLRPSIVWRYRLWRNGHAKAVFAPRGADAAASVADEVHLEAAVAWLGRAQDLSGDGGVIGRYRLDNGWTSSYPETTGYIIPTYIELAERFGPTYLERAAKCVKFLLGTQLDTGAFPAGEIATNTQKPSPFNTAQIINGLLAWHQHGGDSKALEAACRAGRWLVAEQDDDGAWRQWFYHNTPATYSAHLSCWLAELGAHCADQTFLDCAQRHLDWILQQRRSENGWFDNCGFTAEEQSLRVADLHTIAYTLAGTLRMARILKRDDARAAVQLAARAVAGVLDELDWIPGVLDHQWRTRADSACLTGNVQMALIWMDLYRLDGDEYWLRASDRAIELVKQAQLLHSSNPNLKGAIPGPDPMWGWYNDGAVLNWAAKFFIDALLSKSALEATRIKADR